MNESYAACFYLEVREPVHNYKLSIKEDIIQIAKACNIHTNSNIMMCGIDDVSFLSEWQSQFKSQGTKLIPDGAAEQALMYQRMFEGLTFYEKLSKTHI